MVEFVVVLWPTPILRHQCVFAPRRGARKDANVPRGPVSGLQRPRLQTRCSCWSPGRLRSTDYGLPHPALRGFIAQRPCQWMVGRRASCAVPQVFFGKQHLLQLSKSGVAELVFIPSVHLVRLAQQAASPCICYRRCKSADIWRRKAPFCMAVSAKLLRFQPCAIVLPLRREGSLRQAA